MTYRTLPCSSISLRQPPLAYVIHALSDSTDVYRTDLLGVSGGAGASAGRAVG